MRGGSCVCGRDLHRRRGLHSGPEVEDASKIDGAMGPARSSAYAPAAASDCVVAVLFGIVFTAADFGVVYILTHGGPFNSTQVLPTWAFAIGIDSGSLGEGAALCSCSRCSCSSAWACSSHDDRCPDDVALEGVDLRGRCAVRDFLAFPFYSAVTMFKTNLDLANVEHSPYLYNDVQGGFHWDFWSYATTEHVRFLFEYTNYPQWLLNTLLVGSGGCPITPLS